MTHVKSIDEYNSLIKEGKVLVDFFATWCGPCKMLSPILEELEESGEIGDIKIIKVDVDELSEIAMKYGIQSIPTLYLFQDGKLVNSSLGYMPKPALLKFLGK